MIDLNEFRENARKKNLCAEYAQKWDSCRSKKQLMDMALGAKGVDYICDFIAKGIGISPESISKDFKDFINGNYTADLGGYTSKMFCQYKGEIKATTTILTLVDCEACVGVPENHICEIYLTGKCNITMYGEGEASLVCYGKPEDIKVDGGCQYMKRIQKKERDKYE